MYDVFISHSSLDKESFVEPLVKCLEDMGLQVWYDKNNIHKSEKIKESIIRGISESLLFVTIISKNYYKSNWANLELGIFQANKNDTVLPIVFPDVKVKTANKYPFLLEYSYISSEEGFEKIANEIYQNLKLKKNISGLINIEKTSLISLIKELHSYDNAKLDFIAVLIGKIDKELFNDNNIVISDVHHLINTILQDVAETENIYINSNNNVCETFLNMDFLSESLKSHFKFLCQDDNYDCKNPNNYYVSKETLYLIQYSIFSIVEWYMLSYFNKPLLKRKKLTIVAPEDFNFNDINDAYEIEKLVLPPKLIAETDTVIKWFKHNPLIMIGARDSESGKIIGFFNTLPVNNDIYEKIKSGDFDDTKFGTEDILQYDMPGYYKLYLCSFCIHPAYNATAAFKMIYTNFIDFLLSLASEREIYISNIIADGVTPKGVRLCESIGMKRIKTSVHDSSIYEAVLLPPEYATLRLDNTAGRKLIAHYKRIYNSFKEIY